VSSHESCEEHESSEGHEVQEEMHEEGVIINCCVGCFADLLSTFNAIKSHIQK
jgi:hypothetical protein